MSHLACVRKLLLRSNLKFDIVLESPKHKWLEDEVKPPKLVLVDLTLICQGVLLDVL